MPKNSMSDRLPPSWRLALIYLFFSVLWILGSDILVVKLAGPDLDTLEKIQHIKGIAFVIISALLLYFASRKLYRGLEAQAREKEAILTRYKAIHDSAKEGIVDLDLVKDEAVVNEQMRQFMGKDSNVIPEFSAAHILRVHPGDLDRVYSNFNETLRSGAPMWQAEYRYLAPDKTYHDIITKGYFVRDSITNEALHFICTVNDVTEIRDMKAIYHEQQMQHRQMLAKTIITAQENERNRWAEELHDNVCQLLTVAKLLLEHEDNKESSAITKSTQMVTRALNEIRQLSINIKPPEFGHTTLAEAVKELTGNLNRIRSYRFSIMLDELNEQQLNNEQKLMVYRVIQEQFNNIIKYANAKSISLKVKSCEQKVFIEIKDDGVGFDTGKVAGGLGLRNIRSRLQVYAGNLNIDSAPGQGCTLIANFSLS